MDPNWFAPVHPLVILVIISLSFQIYLLFGIISALLILIGYLSGFYVVCMFKRPCECVDRTLTAIVKYFWTERSSSSNCNDADEVGYKIVKIAENVDRSLDNLLSEVLEHGVNNWYYENISSDDEFLFQIRLSVQRACINFLALISKTNFGNLIGRKLLPIFIYHLRRLKRNEGTLQPQEAHFAIRNRRSEIQYQRVLSKIILSRLFPQSTLRCAWLSSLLREVMCHWLLLPLSDAACDPSSLNSLMLYYLINSETIRSSLTKAPTPHREVPLLQKFVDKHRITYSASTFKPDFSAVIEKESLLRSFTDFLRSQQAEHLLQFHFDIESFNSNLIELDTNRQRLDELYAQAWRIYTEYFCKSSPKCITFKSDLCQKLKKALSKDITKFQTSPVIFDAYDRVYSLLSGEYCYSFHDSVHFCEWMFGQYDESDGGRSRSLSGGNSPTSGQSSGRDFFKRSAVNEISAKLYKIKDALKPNAVQEGIDIDHLILDDFDSDTESGEDSCQVLENSNSPTMSNWKVSVATVGTRLKADTNRPYTVFVIDVRADEDVNGDNEWVIERTPEEFYLLDSKLREFHGNFREANLPPRRLLTTRIESLRLYERYLNRIIKKSTLKNSELLCQFLTSTEYFKCEESSLSHLLRKSVAPVSTGELYLEQFFRSFVSNCESKVEAANHEYQGISDFKSNLKIATNKSDTSGLYGNLLNSEDFDSGIENVGETTTVGNDLLDAPSKCFIYAAYWLYNISTTTLTALLTVQRFIGSAIDHISCILLGRLFQNVFQPNNVEKLIRFIRWAIFKKTKSSRTAEEIQQILRSTLDRIALGDTWSYQLYNEMYRAIQNPIYNKQLYYSLMDAMVEELFASDNITKGGEAN